MTFDPLISKRRPYKLLVRGLFFLARPELPIWPKEFAQGRRSLAEGNGRASTDLSQSKRSGLGRVSRTRRLRAAVRNCTRDEGGPFEAGSQVQVSSHRELLSSRAMVASVAETRGGGAQHRLEAAAVQHHPQYPDEPDLCRGVCLWTHDEQGV